MQVAYHGPQMPMATRTADINNTTLFPKLGTDTADPNQYAMPPTKILVQNVQAFTAVPSSDIPSAVPKSKARLTA